MRQEEEVQVLSGDTTPHRHQMKIGMTVAGLAAGFLLLFAVHSLTDYYMRPADTFSDPQLAYAQVEEILGLISEKMTPAAEGLARVDARIQDQVELFNK